MTELLSLEIENFRSYCKTQTIEFGDFFARRVTAVYGPNASGKSNVIKALTTMLLCIAHSASANWRLPYEPFFLKSSSQKKPTRFKIAFRDGERYFTYEFSYDSIHIISEELLEKSKNTSKFRTVFSRSETGELNSTAAKNKFGKRLQNKTRPETLLITKGREDNNEYSNIVFEMLRTISVVTASGSGDELGPQFVEMLQTDGALREKMVVLLQKCDIAIRGIKLDKVPIAEKEIDSLPFQIPRDMKRAIIEKGGTQFKTLHAVRDDEGTVIDQAEFDFWRMESMGTQKFFEVAVPIIDAIDKGRTIFIDEFSTYIHPDLAEAIIKLFRSQPEENNPAKLVLITHNTAMMSALNRDEIYLVEKTLGEESRVMTFAEAGARKDDSFEKRYRAGYYGAVPFIEE